MLLTVTWPANAAVDLDRERGTSCRRAPAGAAGGPAARNVDGPGVAARAARWRPTASARPRCAGGPRARRRASDVRERAERDLAGGSAGHGQPRFNGRSRRPARRRARRIGSSTASPSFTPPREPGQVDHQAAADDAGQPARQHRGRARPWPRRAARIASAMPGTSRSSSGAGHLGRAVGRGEAGAAGGEHDPGAAGDGRRDRLADRLAVGHDDRRVDREAQLAAGTSTISGPVVSS